MHFTQITQPEILLQIDKVGTRTLKFTYESGYTWTVMDIIWSTTKNRADHIEPTGGTVNFFQGGAVSGKGLYGGEVSPVHPLLMNGITYTDIDTLTTHLLTVLNSSS